MNEKQQSLEEIVHQYGRALIVVDEDGKQLQVVQPGGEKVDIDTEEDEYYSHGIELTTNEKKSIAYLSIMDDTDFDSAYSNVDNDDESAEELKVLFDVGFAFARRALTNRRRKKKRSLLSKDGEPNDTETKVAPCWNGYVQVGMKKGKKGKMVPNCVPEGQQKSFFLVEEEETKSAGKKLRDPDGGLTAAGRAHFKKTEGANLKPGVKGAADTPEKMRRKGSFLTRFFTNPSGPMKDKKGRPTRLALSAAAWGESVPQDASDAAALAAKGRKMLERYESAKKKDAWDDVDVKSLGPTIGATGNTSDQDMVDRDGDGVIFDGTPDEKPTPNRKKYEKMPNSYLEKRRRRKVERDLTTEGVKPTQGPGRTEKEKNARSRARDTFSQDEDRKRFVRNQLRKQGIAANAKKEDRDDNERAARKAARAEYDRRVAAGEPKKKPQLGTPPVPKPKPDYPEGYEPGKPADRYPEPKKDTSIQDAEDARNRRKAGAIARNETERFERLRPKDTSSQRAEDARNRAKRPAMRPADRYDDPGPAPSNRAEDERQGRMRPADTSNQRAEDARNRAKRPQRPADRYEKPRPSNPKRPKGYSQGDVV